MFNTDKLIIFSLILIIVASIYWHYQSYIRQQSLENSNSGLQSKITDLKRQLHTTQKTLSDTESELQEQLAMDRQNKVRLQETQAGNWQWKYRSLELEQDNLLQEQANMKHQYETDLVRMKRGLGFQSTQSENLRNSLREKDRQLEELEQGLVKHESGIGDPTRTITSLENRLQEQDKINKQQAVNLPAEPQKALPENKHS